MKYGVIGVYRLSEIPKRWLAAGLAVAVAVVSLFSYWLVYHIPSRASTAQKVFIRSGMSAAQIGEVLEEKGVVSSARLFYVAAKINRLDSLLQAGEYTFPPRSTLAAVIDQLSRGETSQITLTIPEGWTVEQIAREIGERGIGSPDKVRQAAVSLAPYDYIPQAAQQQYRMEGFLFPDTYQIDGSMTEADILRMMAKQFDRQFTPELRQQAAAKGLTPYQLIILASLVEKEAQHEQDRPVIAAVFLKRLQLNMPLQSCATIQYILGYPKAELTLQDTAIPSPYNTYLNPGLPPGPVANPGIASIKAVLQPAQTEYLYFVAQKDGYHVFSRTYAEHLAAIEQVTK